MQSKQHGKLAETKGSLRAVWHSWLSAEEVEAGASWLSAEEVEAGASWTAERLKMNCGAGWETELLQWIKLSLDF